MIKVSAGLCRKIGGANHSSKGGSVHPIGQIAGTGKIQMEIIPRGKITKVPARAPFLRTWQRDTLVPKV
jgi:hypothetical protein